MGKTLMQLPDRTIRDVRAELKIWGNYWYGKEHLSGYARRSACDKLGEVMTNSDSHLYEQELTPPPFVQAYDRLINDLVPECRRALRAYYVCGRSGTSKTVKDKPGAICRQNWALMGFDSKKIFMYWLRKAELELV
jgi:hypothetical protein